MREFIIITDSCCDLPVEYIEDKKIPFVSLTCLFEGKEYKDDFGRSLTPEAFYEGMKRGEIPKTSQPSTEAFCSVFKQALVNNRDIIYICVSSGLSGTYSNANLARNMMLEEYPEANIEIIDILTASLGQGLMVMKAVELKEKGAAFEVIISSIRLDIQSLNTYITVNDLSHLKRGGRISATAAMVGTVLHIKPILTISHEGKVLPVLKIKGRKNSINYLAEMVWSRIANPEAHTLAICHGDCLEEAEKLKSLILSKIAVKNVIINEIGPVVGAYGGPGALAVFFFGRNRQHIPIP